MRTLAACVPTAAGRLIGAAAILGTAAAAFAQDDAAGRAKLAEMVAFFRQASKPCAYTLDATAHAWPAELLSLLFVMKPPITEDEIAAKEKEVADYKTKLGGQKWCELYAVEMREAHLIFTMATNR
jgi:hypothetical protein